MRGTIGIGVIGANPEGSWAATAHLPALVRLPQFRLAAVATTRQASADAAAAKFGAARAHADWRRLLADPEVEAVAVCVQVPQHHELVMAAISAGKHVLCEWPLGLDLREAEAMRDAAVAAGIVNMVGLQGRYSPWLKAIRALIEQGAVGTVVSATLVASLANAPPRREPSERFRVRRESGVGALTVAGGHSLDSFCYLLGEFAEVAALVTTQHRTCEIVGTGEVLEVTAPDQVLVSGRLRGGAVASVHIKTDIATPTGVRLEVNGTDGDIVAATREPVGRKPYGIQRTELAIRLARGQGGVFEDLPDPVGAAAVPEGIAAGPPFYAAQLYAHFAAAITDGVPVEPDFAHAVRRQRLLAAIEAASETGARQLL